METWWQKGARMLLGIKEKSREEKKDDSERKEMKKIDMTCGPRMSWREMRPRRDPTVWERSKWHFRPEKRSSRC
jgi:hypothetical protein